MDSLNLPGALNILNIHHIHFFESKKYADITEQPVPEDSRAWSQVLVSTITGIKGLGRRKGSDLIDGSDVKSANAWCSIDTVRFNSVIKAGTQSELSGSMHYLDQMPFLFFVLWDHEPNVRNERCRIWVVRPQHDTLFRRIANNWYTQLATRQIQSNNFQLHPPIDTNNDVFRNNCGNFSYPLLLNAGWDGTKYIVQFYNPDILQKGLCNIP